MCFKMQSRNSCQLYETELVIVFVFFSIWNFLYQNVRKKGCFIVTVPSIQESLDAIQVWIWKNISIKYLNAIEVIPPQFVGYQGLFPSIFKCYWGIHLDLFFTFIWMNLIFDWNNIDKADIFWNLLINGLVTDGFFCSD